MLSVLAITEPVIWINKQRAIAVAVAAFSKGAKSNPSLQTDPL
jgi:hypothetical protein